MKHTAPTTAARGQLFVGYRTRRAILLLRLARAALIVAVFVGGWQLGDVITFSR